MRDFFMFLQSLFEEWLFYAGGVLTVIPFADRYLEKPFPKYDSVRLFLKRHIKDLRWIGLLCVLFSCYQAWDVEHRNTNQIMNGPAGKIAAWNKYNQCDGERSGLRTLVDTYTAQLESQRTAINQQQATLNSCVLTLGKSNTPEPLKLTVRTMPIQVSHEKVNNTIDVVVVSANKSLTPVDGLLQCASPVHLLRADIADNAQASVGSESAGSIDEKTIGVRIEMPAWVPPNPLVIAVVGTDLNNQTCRFSLRK